MAEQRTSKFAGFLKAFCTSLVGVVSGAALMYLTPVVNYVIKPAKPLPNFAQQASGLTATFVNRSTGGAEGWWDFGDGSALEPFDPHKDTLTHVFPRPGTYSVRLSLQNFIGDEAERTVAVSIDGAAVANLPAVEDFQVIPLKPDGKAPMTFRVVSLIKNADLCIWSMGDNRPVEINTTPAPSLDRVVTFKEEGYFTIKLVAVSGKQTAEKSETVYVDPADPATANVTLQVTYDCVQVEKIARSPEQIPIKWDPKERGPSMKFSEIRTVVSPGHTIIAAEILNRPPESLVRGLSLENTPEKTKIRLSGELLKPAFSTIKAPPQWLASVKVTTERRSAPQQKKTESVVVNLTLPGITLIPVPTLPSGWDMQQKRWSLEIRDGAKGGGAWTALPAGAFVQIKNRAYRVTATEQTGHVRLDVVENRGGIARAGP